MVGLFQRLSNDSVVINLAIDCKGNGFILVGKRLRSTVNTNNTQTFVGKNFDALVIASKVRPLRRFSYLCCWPYNFPTNLDHDGDIASPSSKP
jgi:hypothetical protein